jgi:cupin fold WbuC family metalloprotein
MEKIYSNIDPNRLLHIIVRLSTAANRVNIVPEDNFIQCSLLKMEKGKTFPPHRHITKDRHYPHQIAQESWVVISGRVRCRLYDIDNKLIASPVLEAGDASFTLYGGHTYEILENDTLVYEYKTGPYEGQELDKEFIDAKL